MANANTTVALDPNIKAQAVARAKKEQLSLSDVIRFLLKSYAQGATSAQPILTENGFTLQEEAEINKASEEARRGINISGPFETMDEIRGHLQSLS